jgi:hypothetical protein
VGTYDTRGGGPIGSRIKDRALTPLVETILSILEEAGVPSSVNDKIVALIDTAEAGFEENGIPVLARLESALDDARRAGLQIRFEAEELSTTSGYFVDFKASGDRLAEKFVELVDSAKAD